MSGNVWIILGICLIIGGIFLLTVSILVKHSDLQKLYERYGKYF